MLTAKMGDSRITASTALQRGLDYRCQHCGSEMVLRHGTIVTAHFAHKPGALCEHAGESVEHMRIKIAIMDLFGTNRAELECRVGNRIADVLVDNNTAYEVQLSAISEPELVVRMRDHAANLAGGSIWVFALKRTDKKLHCRFDKAIFIQNPPEIRYLKQSKSRNFLMVEGDILYQGFLANAQTWIEESTWIKDREVVTAGGYYKNVSRWVAFVPQNYWVLPKPTTNGEKK